MKLREYTLDNGPDLWEWSADERREVVIELYERDEHDKETRWPTWIADAISEDVTSRAKERQAVIEALKLDSPTMRISALGTIFAKALTEFPIEALTREAEYREGEWLAEDWAAARERDLDAAKENGPWEGKK